MATRPASAAAVLDAIPDAIITYDRDLLVTGWNAATERSSGIARARALRASLLDLFPSIRGTAVEEEYRRSLAGEVVEARDRRWSPDEHLPPRWYDVRYSPLMNRAGRVAGGIVHTCDVTDRHHPLSTTAAGQRLLRTIVDAAPVGFMAFDSALRIIEWNAFAERRTGILRSEAVGRPLLEVLPDLAQAPDVVADYQRALRGETCHVRDRWDAERIGERRCYDAVFTPLIDGTGTVTGGVMMAIDVTERVQAERSHEQDRAFLRSLIDAAPSSIVAFDRELRQTEWNRRAERNTGISRAAALGRTTEELFPGFLGSGWHAQVQRVLAGETLTTLDYPLSDASTGIERVLDVTMAPVRDADNAIAGALVMSVDVTDRVHIQRALAASEARYRAMFENSAALQLVVDLRTGSIAAANSPFLEFTGRTAAATVGTRVDLLLRSASPGGRLPGTSTEEPMRCELVDAAGAPRVVDLYATALGRDGREELYVVMHDVTQRVRAEIERDRLISILESSTDIVATGDGTSGRVSYMNRAGRLALGVTDDDDHLSIAEFICERDRPLVMTVAIPAALTSGAWSGELTLQARDGREMPVSVALLSHGQDAGHLGNLSAVCRDVSAQRAREQELARSRADAEQANRAKSIFLAGMSHELRTPLGAVIGFAQLLRDGHAGILTAAQQEHLDDVLRGARHLRTVVDDALDLARIEAGAIDVQPVSVDLETLIADAVATAQLAAAEHQVRVAMTIAADARVATLDPVRFRQVVLNYLTNAIKFNSPGGMAEIGISRAAAGGIQLSVRDTGRGISQEEIPQLFQEFQRLGERDVPGSGLGLAITRRIVEAMGGTVSVVSQLGHGSTFFAVLPDTTRPFGAASALHASVATRST